MTVEWVSKQKCTTWPTSSFFDRTHTQKKAIKNGFFNLV